MDPHHLCQLQRRLSLPHAVQVGGEADEVAPTFAVREIGPAARAEVDLEAAGTVVGTTGIARNPLRSLAPAIRQPPPKDRLRLAERGRGDPSEIDAAAGRRCGLRPHGFAVTSPVVRARCDSTHASRSRRR